MTLAVRTFPDPVLTAPSRSVERITPAVTRLIEQMTATMRRHPRCVGLAAPQVGVGLQVAIIDVAGHPKAAASHGLLVLVNPMITVREGEVMQREGCLSVPDLTGNVRRALRVHVEALDGAGRPWAEWIEGFEAIAVQHEVDHLAGKLFLDRVTNPRTDIFRRKQYWFPEEKGRS